MKAASRSSTTICAPERHSTPREGGPVELALLTRRRLEAHGHSRLPAVETISTVAPAAAAFWLPGQMGVKQ